MPDFILNLVSVIIGLGSGMVVSGAVFAFITVVGIVPRFAQKTATHSHCRTYETAITLGGIFGTVASFSQFRLPLGAVVLAALALAAGVFFGSLAMSLAEVLDVFPILSRRGRVQRGIFFFVMAIAFGKLAGSLLYFLLPGFYDAGSM
ncbi:MAG: stage V sporulation protein AB [Defluviitaleaceae bacterium]|nr:stage V sporulation protein AB [Defluviitaleaceae bacterium]MCL2262951.1 stage V sporulation protein AB [Defluviitaleaceae bacterium]